MKTLGLLLLCTLLSVNVFCQVTEEVEKRNSITVGVLQGGGSLIGADFEIMPSKQFGIQIGAGIVGFGAGINYHVKPGARSSFLSLQYWHQGAGESFAQELLGGSFVFRGKKWLTFQGGLAFPLSLGPAMPEDYVQPAVMLMYSIRAYIPL